jgi:LPPG:FO 2-phospho-L-lactate transferase
VITALAGGVGAAKFLAGLVRVVPADDVAAIVNVGDDDDFHGLHVSPDLDSVTYTLAGVHNPATGWGRDSESFRTIGELARFTDDTWFRLGDLDLATHLFRTAQLLSGRALSEVTADIARAFSVRARILPATDERLRTMISVAGDPAAPSGAGGVAHELPMQTWFVRERCEPEVLAVRFDGAGTAKPAPGVLDALRDAETIVICPSNPVISIGPILAIDAVRDVLVERRERVVAVSPIIAGAPVRGPADRLMRGLGIDVSCVGVARTYAPVCRMLVIDERDRARAPEVEAEGVGCFVADTLMRDHDVAADLARVVLAAGRSG